MDPVTIAIALSVFGALAVVVVVITMKRLIEWFRSRGQIKEKNAAAVAFTLAERINGKQYAEVNGVFSKSAPTRIVQGFFDPNTEKIIEARGVTSNQVEDAEVVRNHEEGDGLVIYR